MTLAGDPTAIDQAGMFLFTKLLAPITAPSSTSTPGSTTEFNPMKASLPMTPISKEEKAEYYKNQFGEDAKPYFYSKEENDAAARKASEKVLGKERQAQ